MFWNQVVVMIYLWDRLMYTVYAFSFDPFFSYVYSIFACMHVCEPYVFSTHRDQKRVTDSPEMAVIESYEQPGRCWELDLCPLEEQPEPSL